MGKSTDTLRLLTNEQKAFRDNLHNSGLGYNGPYVLSQAYAKILRLYRAYELCNKNEQLHVFDYEETLEDVEKSQLKMNEFQKDEKVQELKIQPIDYRKLNKLYDNFVPKKDLSAEQTYFSSSCISSVSKASSEEFSSKIKPSMASMPSTNPMLVDLNEMEKYYKTLFELLEKNFFQNRFNSDVKEMKDVFVSVENDLDETFKQNELLKDRLLEASLAEDIKNLVITSCMEIKNKDFHGEIKRISKESKDVSNESKTTDTVCNDAFEVTHGLSKRIVELEKDLSKSEAKKNLKPQLFEFAETKFNNILGKIEFFKKKQLDIFELNKGSVENICDNAKCDLQTKFVELEKVLTQQTQDFDDVKLELSNRIAKFEAYFEKLEKTKAILERQLARKVDDSKAEKDQFLKEINHLRTQLENLKGKSVQTKFGKHSILGKPPADKLLINSQN
ncbi:hypothetical protein Tco_0935121 [Tanacetum coccineum]